MLSIAQFYLFLYVMPQPRHRILLKHMINFLIPQVLPVASFPVNIVLLRSLHLSLLVQSLYLEKETDEFISLVYWMKLISDNLT